jgi:hypothetical protein
MKRIFLFTLLAAPIFWTACGNKTETTEDIVPKGMIALDLGLNHDTAGFPVKINVPDSNYFPTIEKNATANGVQVRIGQHFDILVNTAAPEDADLAKQKTLIAADDAGVQNFLSGDSATLVWETKFGDLSMHHFIRVVKIGADTYTVRDNKDNTENQFKKEDVDKMIESAKSLRARAVAPAPES